MSWRTPAAKCPSHGGAAPESRRLAAGSNAAIERAVLRGGWLATAIAALLAAAWRGPATGIGVALGGSLEMLSLHWLRDGAHALV
ncbi:MAG: hypothetical protein ACRD1E_02465, partial [Terriglobales bacterium]